MDLLTIDKLIEHVDHFKKFDIILLCETWLKSQHPYDMNVYTRLQINLHNKITIKHERIRGANVLYKE